MKRFAFRYEQVLAVRTHQSAVSQAALQRSQSALVEAGRALQEAEQQRLAYAAQLEASRRGGMTVAQWALAADRQTQIASEETARAEAQSEALAAVTRDRAALVEARRQEEVMAKLRERALAAYQQEQAQVEQSGLDEIGAARARRKEGRQPWA